MIIPCSSGNKDLHAHHRMTKRSSGKLPESWNRRNIDRPFADKTLDVVQGSLSFAAAAFGANETQTVDLIVERNGGTQG